MSKQPSWNWDDEALQEAGREGCERIRHIQAFKLEPILPVDFDPPSYLPMQPREAPRIPDLCPDDMGYARVDVLKEVQVAHNPETCRDPACDCMPF